MFDGEDPLLDDEDPLKEIIKDLDGRKVDVALMAARGVSPRDIAKEHGLNVNTIYAWLKDPDVRAVLQDLRVARYEALHSMVAEDAITAQSELRKMIQSSDEKVRLRACKIVQDNLRDLVKNAEVEERVEKIENDVKHWRDLIDDSPEDVQRMIIEEGV